MKRELRSKSQFQSLNDDDDDKDDHHHHYDRC